MATYVMSDTHGNYDRYLEFLRYSNFNDSDTLYIIGDVLDRGSMGISLMQDIMKRENMILLKGNHERMLLPIFDDLMFRSKVEQNEIIRAEMIISSIGQEDTLRDFCKMTVAEQNELVSFISELPVYKKIEVNGNHYILVHGGLPDFDFLPIEYYDEDELLFGPHEFDIDHYGDGSKLIVGHLPTRHICGAIPDYIFHTHDTIAIDCGCGFGGQLGVLCLDTMEEMYF